MLVFAAVLEVKVIVSKACNRVRSIVCKVFAKRLPESFCVCCVLLFNHYCVSWVILWRLGQAGDLLSMRVA
jgi:hypothetical protein